MPMSVDIGYKQLEASPAGRTTCGIRNDGFGYCWGARGESGSSYTEGRTLVPDVGVRTWNRIAPGTSTICGIQTDGKLYCWGLDLNGQFGKGYAAGRFSLPTQVGTKSDWAEVVNNGISICALDTAGSGWCWGSNTDGQLGTGGSAGISAPTPIAGDHKWKKLVASGDGSICGITESNSLLCWGRNATGQLGNLGTGNQYLPTMVAGSTNNFLDVAVSSVTYGMPEVGIR